MYGFPLCTAYITLDVLLCSASIVHLMVISFDRYWGISRPFRSRYKTKASVGLKILAVWLITFLITLPITSLALIKSANVFRDNSCQIYDRYFKIYGSVITFIIPCCIMVISYGRTITLLKKKMRQARTMVKTPATPTSNPDSPLVGFRMRCHTASIRKGSRSEGFLVDSDGCDSSLREQSTTTTTTTTSWTPANTKIRTNRVKISTMTNGRSRELVKTDLIAPTNQPQPLVNHSKLHRCASAERASDYHRSHLYMQHSPFGVDYPNCSPSADTMTPTRFDFNPRPRNQLVKFRKAVSLLALTKRTTAPEISVANEQKASKVLGVVFFCFIFCWAPFFLTNITLATCQESCVSRFPDLLGTVFLWLGYLSSLINPIIYTVFNRSFRRAFSRILSCNRKLNKKRGTARWKAPNVTSMRSSLSYAHTGTPSITALPDDNHTSTSTMLKSNYVRLGFGINSHV